MKLSTPLLQAALLSLSVLVGTSSAFSLSMNTGGQRSPLAAQYKSIMSIHSGITSSSSYNNVGYPRMAPPPGEPEPEVRPSDVFCYIYVVIRGSGSDVVVVVGGCRRSRQRTL